MAEDSVGARIRALRKRQGLSQKRLAAAAGISQQSVSDLEKVPERDPGVTTTLAIAAALGVQLQALVPTLTQRSARDGTESRSRAKVPPGPVADRLRALQEQIDEVRQYIGMTAEDRPAQKRARRRTA